MLIFATWSRLRVKSFPAKPDLMALKKISDYLFCSRLPRLSSYCLCRSVLVIPETKKTLVLDTKKAS